ILLIQSEKDIPFDLKQAQHIIYGDSITGLKEKLTKKVRYFIKHPEKRKAVNAEALKYYVNGKDIETFQTIEINLKEHDRQFGWTINLDVHNTSEDIIDTSEIRLSFIYPVALGQPERYEHYVTLPDNNFMVSISDTFSQLFPKFWIHKTILI